MSRKPTVYSGRFNIHSAGQVLSAKRPDINKIPPVPRDTRTLTARIFGDPLPGRSALDQKREQEQA